MVEEKSKASELRPMVRLIDADVVGTRQLLMALQKVKGVGFSLANAICSVLKFDKTTKIGSFSDEDLKKIEDTIKNPAKHGIPTWMLNRRKDYETGEDMHLSTSDLKLSVEDDIKRMKKIRAYKGMRHAFGLPVRGQKTKAHFRHGKSLGVARKTKKKSGK